MTQGREANLLQNSLTGQELEDDADREAQHGKATIQPLCTGMKTPPRFALRAGKIHGRLDDFRVKKHMLFRVPHSSLGLGVLMVSSSLRTVGKLLHWNDTYSANKIFGEITLACES